MEGALLLLVLLAARGACGEYCHPWADGGPQGERRGGFQCPERYDSPEASFCCGTCGLRYCCSAPEARLDQALCSNDYQEGAPEDPEEMGSTYPPAVPMYLPFLLVGSVFVTFIVVGSLVGICCCKCIKMDEEGLQSAAPPIQSRLLEADPPSDRTPSRHSSSSSSSVLRPSLDTRLPQNNVCPPGPENINMYMPAGAPHFSLMGCPQGAQFLHPPSTGQPYMQTPYLNYSMPGGEHAILMAPASFTDGRTMYGHAHANYTTGAMHGEQRMYPGVAL
ncbi:protein shisa-1-like [Ambystoma mexicanum]|uniref:protein shisa-1-like n=1 Tax=Ambystoma mexicanum TaxID=8296 RepID=UPI0037E740D1